MSPVTDNNVEIVVTGTDKTDPLWQSIESKARRAGKTVGEALSRGAAGTSGDAVKAGGKLGDGLSDGMVASIDGHRDDHKTAGDLAGEAMGEAMAKSASGRLRDSGGRFRSAGEEAGKQAGKGTRKGFLRAGLEAGIDFAKGLLSKTRDLFSDHRIAAPLVTTLVAASPLIGAAVSAAMVAGLSSVTVAGGVALAFKNPTVKAEASALGDFVGKELQQAAGSFVEPTRQALALIRTEWAGLDSDISGAFRAASRYVVPLTEGVMDTLSEIGPGLRKAVESAEPIINVISAELPQMGRAVGDMFEHMGENAEDSAVALGLVFNTMTSSIELIDTAITGLTKSFATLTDFIAQVDEVTPDWTPVGAAANWLNEQLEELRGETETTGHVIHKLGADADGSTYAFEAMAERTEIMAGSMADAVDAAGSLASALDVLNGGVLDAREAEREYQESIDDLSASLKENGKTLDTNTAKGRENAANLDSLASSVAAHMDAVYSETAATKGSAAAQAAASRVYASGRAQVIASARAMGMGKAAAERYADSVLGIPKKWKTDIDADASDARSEAIAARRAINNIPTVHTTYLNVVNRNYGGNTVTGGRAAGGVVGSAQTGGVRSNRTLVGEAGPEILDLAPGTRVHSAPDSARMLAAGRDGMDVGPSGAGGGKLEVRARFDPNASDLLQRAIAEVIRLEVWRSGGTGGIGESRWSPRRA